MNQVAGQVGAECGRQSVNVHAWGKFQEELLRAGLHSQTHAGQGQSARPFWAAL